MVDIHPRSHLWFKPFNLQAQLCITSSISAPRSPRHFSVLLMSKRSEKAAQQEEDAIVKGIMGAFTDSLGGVKDRVMQTLGGNPPLLLAVDALISQQLMCIIQDVYFWAG